MVPARRDAEAMGFNAGEEEFFRWGLNAILMDTRIARTNGIEKGIDNYCRDDV